jgi:hypothetical protein
MGSTTEYSWLDFLQKRKNFLVPQHPDKLWGPPSLLFRRYGNKNSWDVKLTTRCHTLSKLRMCGAVYQLLHYPFMTCTRAVVSYFEAYPQENKSVRGQTVYSRIVHNFVYLCLPLNTECVQYRSLPVSSFMLIIRPRRRSLCACNTEKKYYKSQRLADYSSSTHSRK